MEGLFKGISETLKALGEIKIGRAALVCLILADTVGLGLFIVLICWRDLFLQLSPVKLAMLACAVTLPFVTLGAFMYHSTTHRNGDDHDDAALQSSVVYAVAMHLMFVLMALASVGMREIIPPPDWMPRQPAQTVLWLFSAFYIVCMTCSGIYRNTRIRFFLYAPFILVCVSALWGIGKPYGAHLGLWAP